MDTNIAIVVKQAREVAEQSSNLLSKIQDLASSPMNYNHSQSIDPLFFGYTIFILACFIGYYVVWKVTPALHTPLMSITNAISGVVIISAMLSASFETWNVASILGLIAVFLTSLNIFAGFVVTHRMLKMFKK
jgi:NAD(P) transhydrogenase subunit alpha